MRRGRPPYNDVLTPREWEVLALVERGHTNEEIGKRLGISPATAKFHVSQILSKLEVPNRRAAGIWRIRRVPAVLSLLKGGVFLAGTAAVAAIIYFGVFGLLMQDSKSGATTMGKVAYVVDGDVWVKELPSGPEEQLTKWGDVRGEPQWSASGEWLSVVRDEPYVPQPGRRRLKWATDPACLDGSSMPTASGTDRLKAVISPSSGRRCVMNSF